MTVAAEAATPILPIVYEFSAKDDATAWKVQRIDVNEALSRPYQAVLDLTTEDLTAPVDTLVGSSCLLSVKRGDNERRLCGIIFRVERMGQGGHELQIRIHVGPALALLAQRVDSRIFQEQKPQDIVKQVLEKALKPFKCEVKVKVQKSTYVPREYCVQYNESDLAFVHRLMEEEGMMYGFDHAGERETIIIYDKNDHLGPIQTVDGGPVPLAAGLESGSHAEAVRLFTWSHELTSSQVDIVEYDWTRPGTLGTSSSAGSEQTIELPVYEHWEAERTKAPGNLKHLATVEEGSFAARQRRGLGDGVVSGMMPGLSFELHGHGVPELDQKYLITRVHHRGVAPEARSDGSAPGDSDHADGGHHRHKERYENDFECIPLSQPFLPLQVTRPPRIHGLLTATVVGPGGEEIHVDEHGRIKVQFHWDRAGQRDDKSSCYIRVSQPWAHAGWGTWFVPRIGMEVLVAFDAGDPNKPIVIGTLYNGHNPTPYPLPGSKTKSGIRTNSSPGGGGFNELTFDDAAGAEKVFHQAQKDLAIEVKNNKDQHVGANETLKVDGNREKTVKGNQSADVGGNDGTSVGGSQNVTVSGNRDTAIGGALSESVGTSHTETVAAAYMLSVGAAAAINVGGALVEDVGAAKTETVGGAKLQTIGAAKVVTIGGSSSETIGGTRSFDVKGELTIEVKKDMKVTVTKEHRLKVKEKMITEVEKELEISGKAIKLEAKDGLELKVGGSTVTIKSDSIVIKSSKITLDSSGDLTLKGSTIKAN